MGYSISFKRTNPFIMFDLFASQFNSLLLFIGVHIFVWTNFMLFLVDWGDAITLERPREDCSSSQLESLCHIGFNIDAKTIFVMINKIDSARVLLDQGYWIVSHFY